MIVLSVPHPELLDGMFQHPATRPLLGPRLGAANVCIADDQVEPLRKALRGTRDRPGTYVKRPYAAARSPRTIRSMETSRCSGTINSGRFR